jgi:hypothetical protein
MLSASIFICVIDELPNCKAILYRAPADVEEEQLDRGQGIWACKGECLMVSGVATVCTCSTHLLGVPEVGDTRGQVAANAEMAPPVPLEPAPR